MRLIDAKTIERQARMALEESNPVLMGQILRYIRKQPTIDAAEVVRCKDCEHWVENRGDGYGDGYCASHDGLFAHTKPDDFCSYGERSTTP